MEHSNKYVFHEQLPVFRQVICIATYNEMLIETTSSRHTEWFQALYLKYNFFKQYDHMNLTRFHL